MKQQQGLSLIELMVALLLGTIIIAGVLQVFLGSNLMYKTQDARARMQEDGRYAFYELNQKIRNTSYQAFGDNAITNVLANDTYINHMQAPIEGYIYNDRTTAIPIANGGSGLKLLPLPSNINSDSDILTVRVPSSPSFYISTATGNQLTVPGNNFKKDDIVMASNADAATLFSVDSVSNNKNSITPNASLETTFGRGLINKMSTYTFYIAKTPITKLPSLYEMKDGVSNGGPIAEGVDRMSILYGVDDNGNGKTNGYFTANNVTDWSKVISVRISLVMININSSGNNNGGDALATSNNSSYYLPQADGSLQQVTPNDRRLRTVYTETIILRNRLL